MKGAPLENDLVQLHYVGVGQLDKGLDLFLGDALTPLVVFFLHTLNRNDFTVLSVDCLEH